MKKKHPLRRVMLSTAATVSGIVLLLALKQPADGPATAAVQAPPPAGAAVSAAPPGNAQDAQGGEGDRQDAGTSAPPADAAAPADPAPSKTSAAAQPSATKSSGSSGPGSSTAAKSVTGDTVDAQYGAVQVKITVKDGKITAAEAVQGPASGPGGSAIPTLNQAAVSAQSASIDSVSGATFTSEGYQKSLQSALDKAGV